MIRLVKRLSGLVFVVAAFVCVQPKARAEFECTENYYEHEVFFYHCQAPCETFQHDICDDWCGFYVDTDLPTPAFVCGTAGGGTVTGYCGCGNGS